MNVLVFSIALYGSETWTLTQDEKNENYKFWALVLEADVKHQMARPYN